ncbi:hypothetical protein G6F56_004087 [Rhizopus delemar]|nr:hypothetical protein G6F56_004087 [Rhizopus delemar]
MGPLRFLSCRTSERQIKAHSNTVTSGSKAGINASNNLIRQGIVGSCKIQKELGEQLLNHDLDRHFLYNLAGKHNDSQLLEPACSAIVLDDGFVCGGFTDSDVVLALHAFYRRLYSDQTPMPMPFNYEITIAGRLWKESMVMSSVYYQTKKHQTTRADNFVMFQSGRSGSTRACWFVGEVHTYFVYGDGDAARFFAVVNVMQSHKLNHFNIPLVQRDPHQKHVTVINVDDIICPVGLIRYSENEHPFKVTWQYPLHDDKIDNRHDGMLRDLMTV